ncbi:MULTISPECIES: glycoside hydrolase family 42 [unclassified Lentimonas]|uniref:glycoside hydrolase family 42 n=1 Tax=unclassified Lentimonas TaxID=2630993 RepID=UPI001FCFAC26|nr:MULTISPECIES: glycoside hydrolase family 42 [unclassified Lentimonas]
MIIKKYGSSCMQYGFTLLACLVVGTSCQLAEAESQYEAQALSKISSIESLMADARSKSIDVTREETVVWFSKEFLKFANWDEANTEANEYLFGVYHQPFKSQKKKLAEELPDFERKKVIEMLDDGIDTLEDVLSGKIVRRPVNKVDWQNIEVSEDVLLSNGKPIFLYDYFSKSVGRPLTDTQVYNDHLGAIFHGGENLYPVDHDRAINSFLLQEDGTFDDALLSEITDISDTNVGFLLFWNGGIPDWVLEQEPEANLGRGLFTGFDIDNPLVRDVWGQIAQKSGELTQGKKVTQLGYILSNEPHWYAAKEHWTQRYKEMNALSSYTDANFKVWLEQNYDGDIKLLNQNWKTSFASFDAVTYPFPISRSYRGKPMWYDFCRYNMDRVTDWFTYIQDELRKGNPDADTSIKLQPNLFSENYRSHGIDMEALTELTSIIGDDAKTQWIRNLNAKQPAPWEAHYAYFWEELSMTYDFMESVSPNKIHFNSENHFLSASWVRELDQPAAYVRNVYWLATIQGMDANLAWWWARDPDGSPEDRMEGELDFFDPALAGSYAASANQQPHVVNEVTQVMYDLNSFSEEVMAVRKQRRPIRFFYSETSAINKPRHMSEHFEVYEQLFFEGFPLGYATQKIIQKQDANEWDAILVYKTEFVTDAEFDALQGYLDNGGTVLLDSQSLTKNEYGQSRSKQLKASKGKLVALGADRLLGSIKDLALEQLPDDLLPILVHEDNGTTHKGCTWRVVKNLTGDGYLVNILNLGKHSADLNLTRQSGESVAAVNMLTGQTIGSEFELEPNGVLLLEVKVGL